MSKARDFRELRKAASSASALMKTLGHEDRLMLLCHLAEGEQSVGELAEQLDISQSSLSQHLARMRAEQLVEARRESQNVYYSIKGTELQKIISCLHNIYCGR